MEFHFDNERPIYLQLLQTLRQAIAAQQFQPGERLPSVRELAMQAKVNPNTVQKALGELESAGLIYTERTNGKFVTRNEDALRDAQSALADEITARYLREMQNIGFSAAAAADYLAKEVQS